MRALWVWFLIILLNNQAAHDVEAFVLNQPPVGARVLRVGVMYSGSGVYAGLGSSARAVRMFWQEYVYAQGGMTGSASVYPLFIRADIQSSPQMTIDVAKNWNANRTVDVIMGPENYLSGVAAANAPNLPVIASISGISFIYRCDAVTPPVAIPWLPACEKPYGRRFLNLFASGNVAHNFLIKWFGEVKQRGASTVAIIQDQDSYNQEVCISGAQYAYDYEVNTIFNYTLSGTYGDEEMNYVMTTLKVLQPDIILWCNRPNCAKAINRFYEHQYYPPALMTIQCVDSADAATLGSKLEFVMGASTWDDRLRSATFQDNKVLPYGRRFVDGSTPSATLFQHAWMNYSGNIPATSTQVGVYAGLVLLEGIVAMTNSTRSDVLMAELPRISSYSFAGELQFDPFGVISLSDIIIYQYRDLKTQIVSPANEITMPWVYPAPSWEERIFSKLPFETTVEIVFVLIICLVNAFNILYFAGGFIFFRSVEHIKAISWPFSLLTVSGCVLENFALLTWSVQNNQDQCNGRFLLLIGFALQICPIIAKLFRLDAIFNSKQLRVARIGTVQMLLITIVHMLFFIIPLIVWMSIAPFKVVQIATDPLRREYDYTECQTQWIPFGPIIMGIGGAMLIEASVLAYITRNIDARFRESKALVETFYFILFPIGVSILLQSLLGNSNTLSRGAMFALRTSLLLLASEIYLFNLFGTHIRRAWGGYTKWGIFADSNATQRWGQETRTDLGTNNTIVEEQERHAHQQQQQQHRQLPRQSKDMLHVTTQDRSKVKYKQNQSMHVMQPLRVHPAPSPSPIPGSI